MDQQVKKRMIFAAAIILLAIGGYYGWSVLHPSGPGKAFVNGNCRMEATEIDVSAKLGGRVVNIFANEGDFVQAGQPLAQMAVDSLEAQHDEVLAQSQQAMQSVINAQAQLAARQSDKAGAEAMLAQRESDVEAAQAVVGERESELDAARRRLARSEVLSKDGASSVQENDDDHSRVATAEAALKAAKAQVAAAQSAIDAAKAQVATAEATISAAQAQVASEERAVLASKATVARVGVDIKDSTLTSPRDARVQFRMAEPGEVVAAGGKVFNLVDLGDVYMTFFVPESVAGQVALGSEARVILDAVPQYVIPAKVSFVASVAQYTPKTVETASERQKLMFRVKVKPQIDPELLRQHIADVKTGVPGVAWVKLDPKAKWPKELTVRVPE